MSTIIKYIDDNLQLSPGFFLITPGKPPQPVTVLQPYTTVPIDVKPYMPPEQPWARPIIVEGVTKCYIPMIGPVSLRNESGNAVELKAERDAINYAYKVKNER